MDNSIGSKIKELRTSNKYTLKDLSEKTGLSVGFLSQVERGISSIAIDSLAKIIKVFDMELSDFFERTGTNGNDPIVRGFNLSPDLISPYIVQFVLSNRVKDFDMLPRLFQLQPLGGFEKKEVEMYSHVGEEFVYVLEGVVTVLMDNEKYVLYPGDSVQINSLVPHNWINQTNRTAKLLSINIPNPFQTDENLKINDHIESIKRWLQCHLLL